MKRLQKTIVERADGRRRVLIRLGRYAVAYRYERCQQNHWTTRGTWDAWAATAKIITAA